MALTNRFAVLMDDHPGLKYRPEAVPKVIKKRTCQKRLPLRATKAAPAKKIAAANKRGAAPTRRTAAKKASHDVAPARRTGELRADADALTESRSRGGGGATTPSSTPAWVPYLTLIAAALAAGVAFFAAILQRRSGRESAGGGSCVSQCRKEEFPSVGAVSKGC